MTQIERLDLATTQRIALEPYFAASWQAARNLLRSAVLGADVIKWANGRTCQNGHCGCQGRTRCLHEMAFTIYAGENHPRS